MMPRRFQVQVQPLQVCNFTGFSVRTVTVTAAAAAPGQRRRHWQCPPYYPPATGSPGSTGGTGSLGFADQYPPVMALQVRSLGHCHRDWQPTSGPGRIGQQLLALPLTVGLEPQWPLIQAQGRKFKPSVPVNGSFLPQCSSIRSSIQVGSLNLPGHQP